MKITFNDGQELQIQQVTEQTDGALLIKTISAHEDQLKTLFSDQTTTKRMSVSERDADTVVYENYTKLDAIVKYTAGILGVLMYREGEDPDSRIPFRRPLPRSFLKVADNFSVKPSNAIVYSFMVAAASRISPARPAVTGSSLWAKVSAA